jgi:hypothetical protein
MLSPSSGQRISPANKESFPCVAEISNPPYEWWKVSRMIFPGADTPAGSRARFSYVETLVKKIKYFNLEINLNNTCLFMLFIVYGDYHKKPINPLSRVQYSTSLLLAIARRVSGPTGTHDHIFVSPSTMYVFLIKNSLQATNFS